MRAATILSLTSPSAAAVTAAAAAAALSFGSFRLSVLKRHVSPPNHFLSPTVLLSPSSVNWPKQLRRPFDFRAAALSGGGGTLLHDASAAAAVMAGAYTLVATFDNLTRRKLIEQVLLLLNVHFIILCLLFVYPVYNAFVDIYSKIRNILIK